MDRVATVPLQNTMSQAMQLAQAKLAATQQELNTGKKAPDFASLGTEAVRNLSAHSMLAQQDAQTAVAKRVSTTLSLYQSNIENVDSTIGDLKTQLLTTVSTGSAAGLQDAISNAFDQYRAALNASEGGTPIFAGSQTNSTPFTVGTLADAATVPADQAFADDNVQASARIGDGVNVTYGISASALGKNLYTAFQTLAQAGPISDPPTDAQMAALQTAVGQITTGQQDITNVNAQNGRTQNQVDTLTTRGSDRSLLLSGVIQDNEDADLGQVAIDLSQQQTVLEASYSVFSKLSSLSLVNFLQ